MGKSQRTKGHSFERWTALQFQKLFPGARRNLGDIHGDSGVDLERTGNLAIQCKAYMKYAPITKIHEVQDRNRIPILVTKGDRLAPVAVLYLDDFIKILADVGVAYEHPSMHQESDSYN